MIDVTSLCKGNLAGIEVRDEQLADRSSQPPLWPEIKSLKQKANGIGWFPVDDSKEAERHTAIGIGAAEILAKGGSGGRGASRLSKMALNSLSLFFLLWTTIDS